MKFIFHVRYLLVFSQFIVSFASDCKLARLYLLYLFANNFFFTFNFAKNTQHNPSITRTIFAIYRFQLPAVFSHAYLSFCNNFLIFFCKLTSQKVRMICRFYIYIYMHFILSAEYLFVDIFASRVYTKFATLVTSCLLPVTLSEVKLPV